MRESSTTAARTMMETGSGIFFDFAAPEPAQIALEDIAQALGNTCRFGGHCRFYSVAEHAVLVRFLVVATYSRPDLALAALHHDSHEAYLGDIPTPLKRTLGPAYRGMTDAIDEAIAEALNLYAPDFHHGVVAAADELALRIEASHLKKSRGIRGAWPWRELPGTFKLDRPLGVGPAQASAEFLAAHAAGRPA